MKLKDEIFKCNILGVDFTGVFDNSLYSGVKMTESVHFHCECEFYAIKKGEFIIEGDDHLKNQTVKSGDLAIIPPNYYHSGHYNSMDDTDSCAFRLKYLLADTTKESKGFFDVLNNTLHVENVLIVHMPFVVEIITNIKNELESGHFAGRDMVEILFKKLLIEIFRKILPINSTTNSKLDGGTSEALFRNDRICTFFDKNYFNPDLSAKILAENLNLSVRQVNRIFKEEFNTSFHKKLIKIRLEHAKKLLIKTDLSIEDISLKIGFSSSARFFVSFKKDYGLTPKEFRKQYKKL
ncbi:MAG: helix-turn-helix domain-containing protein [Clostridia bacterium]|nr:helix-turn-helix domain-containing protein [Clostridia bacterium]